MNKTAMQRFAVWAHTELVTLAAQNARKYGITPENRASCEACIRTGAPTPRERKLLDGLLGHLQMNGYGNTLDDAACKCFNRITALRYMELNGFIPECTRFIGAPGFEYPEILRTALPPALDPIGDCSEILLPGDTEGLGDVVSRLYAAVPEEDWRGGVETVGWLYQYFISEKHGRVIDVVNKGTIPKEDIPAATQLFTPDWIVRYMVDNSLGRYWAERHPESRLVEKLEFFVTPKSPRAIYAPGNVEPRELTFFDPCMGSAHILAYAFDVFMEIYRECGYDGREAAALIVENNLFGLDIDDKCSQLAYFAVMMKALGYDSGFLNRGIKPHILSIQESSNIPSSVLPDTVYGDTGRYLTQVFRDAKELGSLLSAEPRGYAGFIRWLDENKTTNGASVLRRLAEQADMLSRKYTVVCTNPPYMNKPGANLKGFVATHFKPYSGDLFSVFIYRCFGFCVPDGYCAFMSPFVWMFIKTYERLRYCILKEHFIVTLAQLEYSAYEDATVPICTFVVKNGREDAPGCYFRLSDFRGGMRVQRQKMLEALKDKECGCFYEARQESFFKIPGAPIAYWAGERFAEIFGKSVSIASVSEYTGAQNKTADNKRFLRYFWEVERSRVGKGKRWIFYAKGGKYRKHYGNLLRVVDWSDEAREYYRANPTSNLLDPKYWYREGITYTMLTSRGPNFRYMPPCGAFDMGGPEICGLGGELYYVLGFLNSRVAEMCLGFLNCTLNLQAKDVKNLPLIVSPEYHARVEAIEKSCVMLSREDWDCFEASWDFERHPLVRGMGRISDAYAEWERECNGRFRRLRGLEVELNRIFLRIYGLEDEASPEVSEKDVTVSRAELSRDIRSLISYAVGCIFGRYSLELTGDGRNGSGQHFFPYADENIILLCGDGYSENNAVNMFMRWVEAVYGKENLEANLLFISKALGGKGEPREAIKKYFLKEFYKDHCRVYHRRPVYWLFDSGIEGGFRALIYMHRYRDGLLSGIRGHVIRQREHCLMELSGLDNIIAGAPVSGQAGLQGRKKKLGRQYAELLEYEAKVRSLESRGMPIDPDNGVAHNYALFEGLLAKIR